MTSSQVRASAALVRSLQVGYGGRRAARQGVIPAMVSSQVGSPATKGKQPGTGCHWDGGQPGGGCHCDGGQPGGGLSRNGGHAGTGVSRCDVSTQEWPHAAPVSYACTHVLLQRGGGGGAGLSTSNQKATSSLYSAMVGACPPQAAPQACLAAEPRRASHASRTQTVSPGQGRGPSLNLAMDGTQCARHRVAQLCSAACVQCRQARRLPACVHAFLPLPKPLRRRLRPRRLWRAVLQAQG